MDRRSFLGSSAVLPGLVMTMPAFAADKNPLGAAAADCLNKGEICLQHCMEMMSRGDTSMADCAKSTREMMVYCEALVKASGQNSKYLKDLAKIAMAACQDCEKQCRKHEKHTTCKECADACANCAKLCKTA